MNLFLNIIWIVFGGFAIAIEYALASVAMMATIVGIPFGLQSLKMAAVALFPFGTKLTHDEQSSGCLNSVMNIIWWIIGGIPIALTHLLLGIFFFITIIGIPFARQHFKLMQVAFVPFGTRIG